MRKVVTSFEIFHNRVDQLGNRTIRFIGLSFLKQQLGLCIELDEQVPDY